MEPYKNLRTSAYIIFTEVRELTVSVIKILKQKAVLFPPK